VYVQQNIQVKAVIYRTIFFSVSFKYTEMKFNPQLYIFWPISQLCQ